MAEGVDENIQIMVQGIRSIVEDKWYRFPLPLQPIELHADLLTLSPIQCAVKTLQEKNDYRKVTAGLPESVADQYVNADGKFMFKHFPLTEITCFQKPDPPTPTTVGDFRELVASISHLTSREESVKGILKHIFIEKLSKLNKNIESWCANFEIESNRLNLTGMKQIEVFKSCLDESFLDWFVVCQKKIGVDANWETWKENLIKAYGDPSWKPINYAFTFKYISGSYVEYTVKKERLLLELDKQLVPMTILDLIVVGLPTNIKNRLNRNSITNVDQLREKLKKYEGEGTPTKSNAYQNSEKSSHPSPTLKSNKFKSKEELSHKSNSKVFNNKTKFARERVPCSICATMGAPMRFHPKTDCWYKDNVFKKESNNISIETPSDNDSIKKLMVPPLIRINVQLPGYTVKGVYDSGSNISLLSMRMAEKLNLTVYTLTDPTFEMISGYGTVLGIAKLEIKIFQIKKEVIVFILNKKDWKNEFLIGLDLIKEFRLRQDENLRITQKWCHRNRKFKSHYMVVNNIELQADFSHLGSREKYRLAQVVNNFNKAFAKDKFDTGQVRDHEAWVKLTEHKYIYRKPYKCNIIDQKEIESQINKLLELGLIEESTSPYAAPVTLQNKKQADGTIKKKQALYRLLGTEQVFSSHGSTFPTNRRLNSQSQGL